MLDNVKEIHIEPTSLCNAECPMCARNVYGKMLNPYIKLKSLPLSWFQENISPAQIKNLDKIFFCGNVGDPATAPELVEIADFFKTHNEKITVGLNTNGGMKTKEWWTKLGNVLQGHLDYCVFSIDGLEDTNHLYRRNVRWIKVMENAEAFINTGASAHWDMLVFEHNKHQVEEAKELAKQMRSEFDKKKTTGEVTLGKDPETGVIILDEDPEWVWIREDASGSYIELRLDKEYGYVLNIIQSEFEMYDFELGGAENVITIQQIN